MDDSPGKERVRTRRARSSASAALRRTGPKDRLEAGFDFLLYQKKAGLQDAAQEAAKEVEADDAGDGYEYDVEPEPMFAGPSFNHFMVTYFKELDEGAEEESRLMGQSRSPCNPCNQEYDERMRSRMYDMYKSYVHPLELATGFGQLYDEPMEAGDFDMMAFVAVLAPHNINKQDFLSGLTGFLAFDPDTTPPEPDCGREGGGFDFLLYQKKAGLQDAAQEAAKEVEKAEAKDEGPAVSAGGPRHSRVVEKLPDRFDTKFVFLMSRDRCSPYARRFAGSDHPASELDGPSFRQMGGFDFLLEKKKKTKRAGGGEDDDGGGWEEDNTGGGGGAMHDVGEEGYFIGGREVLRISPRVVNMQPIIMKYGYRFITEHVLGFMMDTPVLQRFNVLSLPDIPEADMSWSKREPGGFDFLLYQKKAGLQDAAQEAAKEVEKAEEVDTGPGEVAKPRIRKKKAKMPEPFESYTMVARYFCQKADRILVVIDTRRDMWKHFVMLMETIKCFAGKIACVYMYPIDQGTGYIMRRYSDQTWNVCKVLWPMTEPVRIYGNSYRNMGGFRTCFFYQDEDLGKDMYYLWKFTSVRIAYEMQQRAMLAAILGIIFNDMKNSLPKIRVPFKLPKSIKLNIPGFSDAITIPILNRTEQAKREALYSLDYHFYQLQDKERLPPDMFPCEEFFLDLLVYKDFERMDHVDKTLIDNCRRIAEDDMVRIVGRFLEQCPADQLDFDPRSTLCCGKLFDVVVDKPERIQFEQAFEAMRPDFDDKIDTESFVEALMALPVPPGSLGRIAILADHDHDCRLSRDEFIAGMHMALLKMNGLELPMKAPHRYFAAFNRHPRIAIYFRRMTEIGEEVVPGLEEEEEEEEMWDAPMEAADAGKPAEEKKAADAGGGGGGGFFDSIWYQKKAGLQAQAGGEEDMWASFFTPAAPPPGKGKKGKPGKVPEPPATFGAFMAFFKPLKGKKKQRDVQVQENYLQPGGVKMTGSFHIFHVL
ncbi:unnamed protein product [Notodromas monacha]|uniref:EH domain-containing protein n=1 Tax=Notodromas monacha TaxID=399045 RepID=A0A7R9GGM0_9CRUS|nr:unnamed protein product [Notodromas monacha]CAG0920561.1 unnamed protein product [Notodromas monacha]